MVLWKKVAIFDWEWGRNLAPREGRNFPGVFDMVREMSFIPISQAGQNA